MRLPGVRAAAFCWIPIAKCSESTRAPRLKREILCFNDELKRVNFPRRAVNDRWAEQGVLKVIFTKSELPPAGFAEQAPVFGCRGMASAVRLFDAAVRG